MPESRPLLGDARVAELLNAYLVADYRWQYDGGWHDVIIGLPTPGLELAYPDATSFGMLSAWNPLSVASSEAANREADQRLQVALAASGLHCVPAFASARNRTWREPSWLVMGMDTAAFDALAREFGQLGTLWWRPGSAVRLRMDAPRPAGIDDDRDVDWIE